MHPAIHELILNATGAEKAFPLEVVQRLWRGYGQIVRYGVSGGERSSVIVKQVNLAKKSCLSHQRKLRSYRVETAWYTRWSPDCDADCRVPACLGSAAFADGRLLVLEDLNPAGYPHRRTRANPQEIKTCLLWLAHFHATFFGQQPTDLWPTGTYWHLQTRPDEWQALTDINLKNAAAAIDQTLRDSPYQTFVHGDAKLANFCFSADGRRVAAVDFQYVGGGPGIKDVAYFIDSCLDGEACEHQQDQLLDVYFQALKRALHAKQKAVDADAVVENWRSLYPLAWTDFQRFLKGWSPGHWPSDSYSERLARQVISQLQIGHGRDDAPIGN